MAVATAKVIVNLSSTRGWTAESPQPRDSALFSRDLTTIACCFAQFSSV
jgi:hypothetical protein